MPLTVAPRQRMMHLGALVATKTADGIPTTPARFIHTRPPDTKKVKRANVLASVRPPLNPTVSLVLKVAILRRAHELHFPGGFGWRWRCSWLRIVSRNLAIRCR